jgi:hypothetical protein
MGGSGFGVARRQVSLKVYHRHGRPYPAVVAAEPAVVLVPVFVLGAPVVGAGFVAVGDPGAAGVVATGGP